VQRAIALVADLTAVIAAIAVVVVAVNQRERGIVASRTRVEAIQVQVNGPIKVPGVDFRLSDRTLVLVASTSCRYCTNSLPFYKRLSELGSREAKRLRFVVVGQEPVERLEDYFSKAGVSIDQITSVAGAEAPSLVTPTLILVDQRSIVGGIWRGQQSSENEEEVIRAVSVTDMEIK
jgi:hypothetical protein